MPGSTRSKRLTKGLVVALASLVLFAALAWVGSAVARSRTLYREVTAGTRGWKGEVHTADPRLGVAPVPGARGAEVLPIGDDVPMRFDEHGFRAVVGSTAPEPRPRPLVMAFGCSFTYGAGVLAEEAYPYLVAEGLGGTALNAGVCSWGLAQMLLRARDLIPEWRPDVVLVQYADWLVARAIRKFGPAYVGKLPSPRFVDDGKGGIELAGPAFSPIGFDLPISRYHRREAGFLDFLRFTWDVGLPLFAHDDWHELLDEHLGAAEERPAPNAVVESVYAELQALCDGAGARMVIVLLGRDEHRIGPPMELAGRGYVLANAHNAMVNALPQRTPDAYARAYKNWRGDPPVMVDAHPNPHAHRVIAGRILETLSAPGRGD